LNRLKDEKKRLKNEERTGKAPKGERKDNKNGKKDDKLKGDKKALDKTLEIVQKSNASVGKFSKKIKNEKEINTTKKQKINKDIFLNRKTERDRDKKILEHILRK
jgi:hypothetical protein